MLSKFRQFLFSTAGRISRSQLWLKWLLPFFVIYTLWTIIVGELVFVAIGLGALSSDRWLFADLLIIWISFLFAAWSFTAVLVKRIHDRNKSGWLVLFLWAPGTLLIILPEALVDLIEIVVSVWFLIEFGCMRGTVGANQYGPDPVPQA